MNTRYLFALIFSLSTALAYAEDEVPVVDAMEDAQVISANTPAAPSAPTVIQTAAKTDVIAPGSATQLLDQINSLQTQVQKLQGQIEVQDHALKQLTEQVRSQYQDLDQRMTKTTPPPAAVTPPPPTNNKNAAALAQPLTLPMPSGAEDEQKLYQNAYDLIRHRDYVRATSALQGFITKFPSGAHIANAHYWLGEIYLLQGQPDPAIGEFNTVINNYPAHPKLSNAMLKIGFAYYDKGDFEKAKGQLLQVEKKFPNTPIAQLAFSRLEEMKQQGR